MAGVLLTVTTADPEQLIARIRSAGLLITSLESTLLVPYETFAQTILGVNANLTAISQRKFNGTKQIFWFTTTIGYQGNQVPLDSINLLNDNIIALEDFQVATRLYAIFGCMVGMNRSEFATLWAREATAALTLRASTNRHAELFKVVTQNKVILFHDESLQINFGSY